MSLKAHLLIALLFAIAPSCNDAVETGGRSQRTVGKKQTSQKQTKSENGRSEDGSVAEDGSSSDEGSGSKRKKKKPDEPVEVPLEGCAEYAVSIESDVVVDGTANAPIVGPVDFHIEADVTARMKRDASAAGIEMDVILNVVTPDLARSQAEQGLATIADPIVLTLVSGAELDELQSKSPWKDVGCLVLPIKRVKNASFDIEYSPAIPLMISPAENEDDYLALLDEHNFSGIKATINQLPEGTDYTPGAEYTGSAKMTPGAIDDAFKVAFDFGDLETTALATPFQSLEFHIDHAKKAYHGFTLEVILGGDVIRIEVKQR